MGKKMKYEGCRNRTHQGGNDEFKPSNKLITMHLAEPMKLKNDMEPSILSSSQFILYVNSDQSLGLTLYQGESGAIIRPENTFHLGKISMQMR